MKEEMEKIVQEENDKEFIKMLKKHLSFETNCGQLMVEIDGELVFIVDLDVS